MPVRCTLFVDTSHSVRLGVPGRNALALLIDVAAAVAQANSNARDMTGICLFDESTTTVVRPARNAAHLSHLLKILADAAGLSPGAGHASVDELLPLAYSVAGQIYPDLLRPEVNHVPFWMPWLWPLPAYTSRRSVLSFLGNWFFMASAFTPFILTVLLVQWLLENVEPFVRRYAPVFQQAYADLHDAFLVSAGFGAFFYGWLMMRIYRARSLLFSSRKRRHVRWRKQMAALLSFRYDLSPGGLGRWLKTTCSLCLTCSVFSPTITCRIRCRSMISRATICSHLAPRSTCWLQRWFRQSAEAGITNSLFCSLTCWNSMIDWNTYSEPCVWL